MKDRNEQINSKSYEPQAKLLGALANPIRLGVLHVLMDGPAIVGELSERCTVEQTSLSKHLAVLKTAGLVDCKVDGRRRLYALSDKEAVEHILNCLHNLRQDC